MRELTRVLSEADATAEAVADTLTLTLEERRRSRQRARLDGGDEVALLLPRGTALRHGDLLGDGGGFVVRVRAAVEPLSTVRAADPWVLTRAAYHLGNRHVPLQITRAGVQYPHDHVLDDMVRALGLEVGFVEAPFEPEEGAYAHGHRGDGHGHAHGHSHAEAHTHAQGHRYSHGEAHAGAPSHSHTEAHAGAPSHSHTEAHGHARTPARAHSGDAQAHSHASAQEARSHHAHEHGGRRR